MEKILTKKFIMFAIVSLIALGSAQPVYAEPINGDCINQYHLTGTPNGYNKFAAYKTAVLSLHGSSDMETEDAIAKAEAAIYCEGDGTFVGDDVAEFLRSYGAAEERQQRISRSHIEGESSKGHVPILHTRSFSDTRMPHFYVVTSVHHDGIYMLDPSSMSHRLRYASWETLDGLEESATVRSIGLLDGPDDL